MEPQATTGRLEHHPRVSFGDALEPRHVDVWLPNAYARQPNARYRVLYMHDGQNLFDAALAYGEETWGIAETLTRLAEGQILEPVIVVGIWNSSARWRDYYPQPAFDALKGPARFETLERLGGEPLSRQYVDRIALHLKPWVDARYRTRSAREDTFILGSSMGGLISLYALESHPAVFGGAACLSTHWLAGEVATVDALAALLPPPGAHRLYFDYGTQTLDAGYEPFQQRMDAHLERRGWTRGTNWLTERFEGAAHDERSWRERLEVPLRFLLTSEPVK